MLLQSIKKTKNNTCAQLWEYDYAEILLFICGSQWL